MAKLSPEQKSALTYAGIGRLYRNSKGRWQRNNVSRTFGEGTMLSLFGFGLLEGDHKSFAQCRFVWASAKGRELVDQMYQLPQRQIG